MGGAGLKVAIGAFFVWLSAQAGTFADEILARVRESVQASELLEIDHWVYQASVFDDAKGKVRAPDTQEEFEKIVRDSLQATGRDSARDRWEEPYVYEKLLRKDPRDVYYRIASKGGDRALGTDDDLVVERENDRATINRDPAKIAEQAIERKTRFDALVQKKLEEIVDQLPKSPSSDEKDVPLDRQSRAREAAARALARRVDAK